MSILALLAAAALAGPGPQPDRATSLAAAEVQISGSLVDPASAVFDWPYSLELIDDKPIFGKQTRSWRTCGTLNARNKMGGYTGTAFVIVAFEVGKLTSFGIGEDDRLDPVNIVCGQWVKSGKIRLLAASEKMALNSNNAVAVAAKGSVGIAFIPSPAGAVIMAVAPGSPAERAGLKAGETIEALNGVSLKSMDQMTILKVMGALPSSFVMSIVGVGQVPVDRP